MPYSVEEQDLYDFAKGSLPRWFFARTRAEEEFGAYVKIFDRMRQQMQLWFDETYILLAEGGSPDWLNQHARDRGTSRQEDETDDALRSRLRTIDDQITNSALSTAANAIISAQPAFGTVAIVELRLDRAFFRTRISPTGTGDSFAKSGNVVTLTDAATTFNGAHVGDPITIAGATSGGNNGTFTITGFVGNNAVTYVNAAGVAEAYAGTWTINANYSGRKDAYLSRGYRMTGTPYHNSYSGTGDSLAQVVPVGGFVGEMQFVDAGTNFTTLNIDLLTKVLTLTGATSAGNNGAFSITQRVSNTALRFINSNGVTESFPGTWVLEVFGRAAGIIVIIPYGKATGTGDSFAKSGTTVTLTDAGFDFLQTDTTLVGQTITIAGATSGGNNGTFTITAVPSATSVQYTNAAGVAEAYSGTWTLNTQTTAATQAAIREMLRQRAAGGYIEYTERRLNP